MLTRLSIRDVVLIETLDLDFGPGLGVLTGETGAGKSILLDALGLALGARADSGLVRAGQAQASVSTSFDLPPDHPALALLDESGLATAGIIATGSQQCAQLRNDGRRMPNGGKPRRLDLKGEPGLEPIPQSGAPRHVEGAADIRGREHIGPGPLPRFKEALGNQHSHRLADRAAADG